MAAEMIESDTGDGENVDTAKAILEVLSPPSALPPLLAWRSPETFSSVIIITVNSFAGLEHHDPLRSPLHVV